MPIAILLFGIKPEAVLFVTLAGSIPAVIVGTVAAIDTIPPILLQAGDVLGARGDKWYVYVVLPAALPAYIAGVRQAWAFAWRSLMAGRADRAGHGSTSLGQLLSNYQDQSLAADVLAVMMAILAIGLLMDAVVFSASSGSCSNAGACGWRAATTRCGRARGSAGLLPAG